ncbi:hypothetical protein BN133_593 [Cronobacter dublinensis 582]|nr:hypothetical protein BN133_593 [Cronobacter dublinensis 582]
MAFTVVGAAKALKESTLSVSAAAAVLMVFIFIISLLQHKKGMAFYSPPVCEW